MSVTSILDDFFMWKKISNDKPHEWTVKQQWTWNFKPNHYGMVCVCVCPSVQVSIALSTDLCIKRKRAALFMPFDFAGDFPFTNHNFYWWFDHQLIACTHSKITNTTLWMFFHISFPDARNLWLIFLWIIFRFIFLGINFGNRSVVSANYPAMKYTAFISIANSKTSLYITSSNDQLSNCICVQY